MVRDPGTPDLSVVPAAAAAGLTAGSDAQRGCSRCFDVDGAPGRHVPEPKEVRLVETDAAVGNGRPSSTDLLIAAERSVDGDDGVSGAFPVCDGVGVVRGHDDECPVARGRWRGEQHDEVLPGRGGVLGGADSDRRREHGPVVLPERQVGGGQVDHDAVWRRCHTYVLRAHPCGRFVGSLGQSDVVPPRARGNHRQDRGGSLPFPRHGSRLRATWSGKARDGAVCRRDEGHSR